MTQKDRAALGILMLDTRFPRIPGDVGNKASWPFPVRFAVVPGAAPDRVVGADADPLLENFIAAGRDLVAGGCTGIATSCGFLAPQRQRLADALGVPVAASALEQAALIQQGLPAGRRVGILTISAQSLGPAHLRAAGVPAGTPIAGMEGSAFAEAILNNRARFDLADARRALIRAAQQMQACHPDLGALLLECTNMGPYAPDIAAATGLPMHSILSYLRWFHAGLCPPAFPAP